MLHCQPNVPVGPVDRQEFWLQTRAEGTARKAKFEPCQSGNLPGSAKQCILGILFLDQPQGRQSLNTASGRYGGPLGCETLHCSNAAGHKDIIVIIR